MTTTNRAENATAQAPAKGVQQKRTKKALVAPPVAHVAPKKGKSAPEAKSAKKAPKGHKKAGSARNGSKTANVVDLLKRPGGASLQELMSTTGWQAHSVRGFLSGTIGKKMGLSVTSFKGEEGERTYSVKP